MYANLIGFPEAATPTHFGPYLTRLNSGLSLTYHEAADYMRLVLAIDDPRTRSAQLGVLLNGFMAKSPTVEEASGVIDAALALDGHDPATRPSHPFPGERVVGIAGSGKKGFKTPNISTPAAVVAAAAGIKVAKCASTATSSIAGSADTLKCLGVRLSASVPRTLDVMAECGLGVFEIEQIIPRFDAAYGGLFYAPHVLSLALPALLLPIQTDTLLYGIAHPDVSLSLEVLRRYHSGDLCVVSSTPDNVRWLDEVGIIGETTMVGVRRGVCGRTLRLNFADQLGVGPFTLGDLAPGLTVAEQARIVVEVLTGRGTPALTNFVAANAATLIFLGEIRTTMPAAFDLARELLFSGAAFDKLRHTIRATGGSESTSREWM